MFDFAVEDVLAAVLFAALVVFTVVAFAEALVLFSALFTPAVLTEDAALIEVEETAFRFNWADALLHAKIAIDTILAVIDFIKCFF